MQRSTRVCVNADRAREVGSRAKSQGATRTWKFGYETYGFRALFDKRKGKQSWRKAPAAEVERVLSLYRYYDLNVVHFQEKLAEEPGIRWSYSWVQEGCHLQCTQTIIIVSAASTEVRTNFRSRDG